MIDGGLVNARVVIDEAAMVADLDGAWNAAIRPTLADLYGPQGPYAALTAPGANAAANPPGPLSTTNTSVSAITGTCFAASVMCFIFPFYENL